MEIEAVGNPVRRDAVGVAGGRVRADRGAVVGAALDILVIGVRNPFCITQTYVAESFLKDISVKVTQVYLVFISSQGH